MRMASSECNTPPTRHKAVKPGENGTKYPLYGYFVAIDHLIGVAHCCTGTAPSSSKPQFADSPADEVLRTTHSVRQPPPA